MLVKELMTTNVCFVKSSAGIQDVAKLMRQFDIGFVPVCNELGELHGVVTDRDLIMRFPGGDDEDEYTSAADLTRFMTQEVFTLSPDMDIHEAALIFAQKKLHRLPVLQGNRLVGILSVSDLAKKRVFLAEVGEIIGAITKEKYAKTK